MRGCIIKSVAELGTEIIRHDLSTCRVDDIRLMQGIVVGISREVEVQGEIAVHDENLVKVVESADEVVEEGWIIELQLEFPQEVGDIVSALPNRDGWCKSAYGTWSCGIGRIECAELFGDLDRQILLRHAEVKEGAD